MARPKHIGVTGGIGSGKSLICRIFGCLLIPVYDADSRAKNLMTTDRILIREIQKEFGTSAYKQDGTLNREYLRTRTFGFPEELEKLNRLVHPRVAADYQEWSTQHSDSPYVIREAALLYEIGAYRTIDKMIVVAAPEKLRVERVLRRDPQRSPEEVRAIMNSQWSQEEKEKRADFVIHNDDQHMVIPQVLQVHDALISLSREL